jgi:hypothetical protein
MDDQLLQRSSASSAKASYGEYCTSSIASSLAGANTPFVLPEDYENDDGNDGYTPPDGSLADYYDLSKHLDGDRTTLTDNEEDSTANSVDDCDTTSPSALASSGNVETPVLSSSRAYFAPSQVAKAASTISVENLSDDTSTLNNSTGYESEADLSSLWHSIADKHLSNESSTDGTAFATLETDMMRRYDNSLIKPATETSAAGLVSTISTSEKSSSHNSNNNDGNSRSRDPRDNASDLSALAGAMAVQNDDASTPFSTGGDDVKMPKMQEISKAILDEMERMKNDPQKNSVSISLNMADGTSVDLRLRWRGNHVKASFGQNASAMQSELENGWGSLSLRAGSMGMNLEAPTFDADENQLVRATDYYA